ncbi:MAG: DinB family protein [Gemmatimonadaceae bacterium]
MADLHPRIAEIVAALHDAHAEMRAQLAAIPAALHDLPAPDGRWSIAQHIEHLAMVDDGAGRVISNIIKQVAAADAKETDDSSLLHSLDAFRPWAVGTPIKAPAMVEPAAGLSAAEALERLEACRARMIGALERGSGLALGTVHFPHPVIGPITGYQWGLFPAHHQRRHTAQIRALGATLSA